MHSCVINLISFETKSLLVVEVVVTACIITLYSTNLRDNGWKCIVTSKFVLYINIEKVILFKLKKLVGVFFPKGKFILGYKLFTK